LLERGRREFLLRGRRPEWSVQLEQAETETETTVNRI
jgi:hypothetical protein